MSEQSEVDREYLLAEHRKVVSEMRSVREELRGVRNQLNDAHGAVNRLRFQIETRDGTGEELLTAKRTITELRAELRRRDNILYAAKRVDALTHQTERARANLAEAIEQLEAKVC